MCACICARVFKVNLLIFKAFIASCSSSSSSLSPSFLPTATASYQAKYALSNQANASSGDLQAIKFYFFIRNSAHSLYHNQHYLLSYMLLLSKCVCCHRRKPSILHFPFFESVPLSRAIVQLNSFLSLVMCVRVFPILLGLSDQKRKGCCLRILESTLLVYFFVFSCC